MPEHVGKVTIRQLTDGLVLDGESCERDDRHSPAVVLLTVEYDCGEHDATWLYCGPCAFGMELEFEDRGTACPYAHGGQP